MEGREAEGERRRDEIIVFRMRKASLLKKELDCQAKFDI